VVPINFIAIAAALMAWGLRADNSALLTDTKLPPI
jgi:hypothetical protein